jgi:hypothetical protein
MTQQQGFDMLQFAPPPPPIPTFGSPRRPIHFQRPRLDPQYPFLFTGT